MMYDSELIPVSIGLLYDGMVVPHDIYDGDQKFLLIRAGKTLSASQIETIRHINRGKDTIRVSVETRRMMLEHEFPSDIGRQAKLERETGYTEIKNETLTLYEDIQNTSAVQQDTIHEVSERLVHRLEVVKPGLILDLINALAPVDEYLQRHCINVSLLNGLIGRWLSLSKDEIDLLVLIGLMHDCGKALLPPQILSAPRPLTVAEYEVIKMHPVQSYELLAELPANVRHGACAHHEKTGGQGYPYGLLGPDIPITARITAVSDIYDAMVSRRAYKYPQSPFHIMAQLRRMCETELDPLIVDTFTSNMPKELVNKAVTLSNGELGVIYAIDPDDLEYPVIKTGNQVVKSSRDLYCVSMCGEEEQDADG